jgi:hypothetical protein
MRGRLAAAAAVAVLSLSTAASALAGFRIEEIDLEFPKEISVHWFQAGKARVDGALEGLTVIVDVKNGEGWLIDAASKRYAGGKIVELAEILRKIDESLDHDETRGASPGGAVAPPEAKPLAVVVKDLGPGERLQGYDTRHSQVLLEGEVLEELWLAPKIQVAKEIDLVAFSIAMQQMLGGGAGVSQGYEESETYRNLRAGGYPLRQVLYFVGEKSTLEVTSVAAREFSPADFAVPKGYAKVGYAELLLGESE